MEILNLDISDIDSISHLWQELNLLHFHKTTHFKSHFENMTFETRKKALLANEKLLILVVNNFSDIIGYLIASVNNSMGEIDSLYIRPEFRKSGIGSSLTIKAIDWLNSQNCSQIKVAIAEGNEKVLDFYSKFGFHKRFYIMQK
jgi:ribosomal protein S18 acetylase RimI-like enzyme